MIGWLCLAPFAGAGAGAGPPLQPLLETPEPGRHATVVRAAGHDPAAPRALVLWRWDGTSFLRLATTRSQPGGRFDFGLQAVPGRGLSLHVAAEGEAPSVERALRVDPPLPAPIVVADGLEQGELVLAPARPEGELRLYDASTGRLLLRVPVGAGRRGRVTIDLEAVLPRPWPTALSIEQVVAGSRRSPRQFWPLDDFDAP